MKGTQITENFIKTIRTFSGEPKLFCLKGNFNARIKTFRELRTLVNRISHKCDSKFGKSIVILVTLPVQFSICAPRNREISIARDRNFILDRDLQPICSS